MEASSYANSWECLFELFSVYTAIQGIIDATNDQLKEIEKECAENNEVRWPQSL